MCNYISPIILSVSFSPKFFMKISLINFFFVINWSWFFFWNNRIVNWRSPEMSSQYRNIFFGCYVWQTVCSGKTSPSKRSPPRNVKVHLHPLSNMSAWSEFTIGTILIACEQRCGGSPITVSCDSGMQALLALFISSGQAGKTDRHHSAQSAINWSVVPHYGFDHLGKDIQAIANKQSQLAIIHLSPSGHTLV